MDNTNSNYTEEELDELEDKLLEEDFEKHQEDMAVDGRSVFEIERLKRERGEAKGEKEEDR